MKTCKSTVKHHSSLYLLFFSFDFEQIKTMYSSFNVDHILLIHLSICQLSISENLSTFTQKR